ncbi:Stp1/IreP family PP2C-type Ser/Thr phosphatase [Dendrosporobacter sp. 1207_IL3150]|uniref:Stp1/IreP family PP2C-type Ser/Thr phosphatase n=1 Tax=Dendrosporobacter sp. 1207_IL3150 TaxID=3084054 RepID=UPI002FDAED68
MLVFAKSDIGLVRQTNEDSYACIPPDLFLVADGMGGHVAGEIASSMAVKAISEYVQANKGTNVTMLLEQALIRANELIFDLSQSRDECAGMGTTVSVVHVDQTCIHWGHVGDSRIYVVRDSDLVQVTNDHSLVWELVKSGNITKAEAHTHPQRNMLTRAVGTSKNIKVDTGITNWKQGDFMLLCTDGLTNMLSEQEIYQVLIENMNDGEKVVNKLIDSAKRAGGNDNITVILLKNEGL